MEAGRVDAGAVRRHRERARSVGEEGDDGERRTAQRAAEVVGVEHPDVRAPHARGGELGIERDVLAPVGRGDERPLPPRSGEDDVARLVAHQERALDLAGQVVAVLVELDDAHAVREVVDHPDLMIVPGRHGDRLEAHRDGGGVDERAVADAEDLQAVVRRVDGEQVLPVRRQRERPHLPALEEGERGRVLRRAAVPGLRIRRRLRKAACAGDIHERREERERHEGHECHYQATIRLLRTHNDFLLSVGLCSLRATTDISYWENEGEISQDPGCFARCVARRARGSPAFLRGGTLVGADSPHLDGVLKRSGLKGERGWP